MSVCVSLRKTMAKSSSHSEVRAAQQRCSCRKGQKIGSQTRKEVQECTGNQYSHQSPSKTGEMGQIPRTLSPTKEERGVEGMDTHYSQPSPDKPGEEQGPKTPGAATYVDLDLILGASDDAALDTGEHLDLADNLLAQEVADLNIGVVVHGDVDGEMGVHGLQAVLVALRFQRKKYHARVNNPHICRARIPYARTYGSADRSTKRARPELG